MCGINVSLVVRRWLCAGIDTQVPVSVYIGLGPGIELFRVKEVVSCYAVMFYVILPNFLPNRERLGVGMHSFGVS